jgi:outer membrane protein TolC
MRLFSIMGLLLALAAPVRAERAISLDEALKLARDRNKDLKAAHARIDQAAAGITQAYVALLPLVTASGKYTHNYKEVTLDLAGSNAALFGLADTIKATSGNALQNGAINQFKEIVAENTPASIIIQRAEQLDFSLAATVPLVVPWAYSALTAAKKTQAAAVATYDTTEAMVLTAAAQGFFAAAGADELLVARRNAIAVAKKTLDNAKARLEAGVVNRVEVTRAELALLRAEQAAREAEDTQAMAYRSLRTILQLDEPFRVVETTSEPVPEASPGELAQNALKLRPEFIQLERTLQAQDAQISSAKWRWAPTLSGFGSLRAFNYPGFANDNYSWALGLSLDWVIYDGGQRDYQAKLADAQRKESYYRLAQLKDTVADDIFNARRTLETKRKALATAIRSVGLSKETLDLVRVQHDAGTATQLDLLTAQDNLVGAEVAVAQARFDLSLSDVQLRRAAGLFPPK